MEDLHLLLSNAQVVLQARGQETEGLLHFQALPELPVRAALLRRALLQLGEEVL